MKTVQQLGAAYRHRCLRQKVGDRLRAMYADEASRKLPTRLLAFLKDFEQVEVQSEGSQVGLKKAIAGGN
jgi:hypothetical protein